jgi:hypothetical protein
VACPEPLHAFFYVSLNFCNVSLAAMIFSLACVSFYAIPSIVFEVIWAFKFSALSCTSCLTMPYIVATFVFTLCASSCSVSIFCASACCCALMWFIYEYNFLFSAIASIIYVGGNVLIASLNFCTFSYVDCIFCQISYRAASFVS